MGSWIIHADKAFWTTYPGTTLGVREARKAVTAFAASCGFADQALDDVCMGVGEALANAFEHGGGGLSVAVAFDGNTLVVDVQDDGNGFNPAALTSTPADQALRGFGSSIMRAVMDEIAHADGGRRVRLSKRLRTAAGDVYDLVTATATREGAGAA